MTITVSATTSPTATTNDKWQATINSSSLSNKVIWQQKHHGRQQHGVAELLSTRNWVSLTLSWQRSNIAANDNNNVNSVMAVQGERVTRGIALPWLSSLLLQQLVAYMFVGEGNCFCMQTGEAVVATAPLYSDTGSRQQIIAHIKNDCSSLLEEQALASFSLQKTTNSEWQFTGGDCRSKDYVMLPEEHHSSAERKCGNGIASPWQRGDSNLFWVWGAFGFVAQWQRGSSTSGGENPPIWRLVAKNRKRQSTVSSHSTEVVWW